MTITLRMCAKLRVLMTFGLSAFTRFFIIINPKNCMSRSTSALQHQTQPLQQEPESAPTKRKGSHRSTLCTSEEARTALQARARTRRPSLEKPWSLPANCAGTANTQSHGGRQQNRNKQEDW